MRVPDPEDPKYYPDDFRFPEDFIAKKYIEDFRKWKAELQHKLEWLEKNCVIHGSDRHSGWVKTKMMWAAQAQILKEILGETEAANDIVHDIDSGNVYLLRDGRVRRLGAG
jgi:hypothetical protein